MVVSVRRFHCVCWKSRVCNTLCCCCRWTFRLKPRCIRLAVYARHCIYQLHGHFGYGPPPPPQQSHCSANAGRGLFLFVYLNFSPPLTYVVTQGRQPPSHPTHPQQEVLCTRSLGSPQFFMLMPKLHIFSLATLHMSNLWISVVCTG